MPRTLHTGSRACPRVGGLGARCGGGERGPGRADEASPGEAPNTVKVAPALCMWPRSHRLRERRGVSAVRLAPHQRDQRVRAGGGLARCFLVASRRNRCRHPGQTLVVAISRGGREKSERQSPEIRSVDALVLRSLVISPPMRRAAARVSLLYWRCRKSEGWYLSWKVRSSSFSIR